MDDSVDSKCSQNELLKKSNLVITPIFMTQHAGPTAHEISNSKVEEKSFTQEYKDISPIEDLMREHGILNRILLIYEEMLSLLESRATFQPEVLMDASWLVRSFIEDHHGKLEEGCLFPRFEKAGKLVDLIKILREQHRTGRRLTDHIMALATPSGFQTTSVKRALARNLRLFNRMFRSHAAREDTVLFPAFYSIVSQDEFSQVVEEFEAGELELSGKDAIEKVLKMVADLEKTLGIYELSRLTPRV